MGNGYWAQSGYVYTTSIRNIIQSDTRVASCTYDPCRNARTYKICAKIDVLRTYKRRAEMHVHIHVKWPLLLSDFN
jgi:DNA transposition AAA+ family ATPase